MGFCVARSDRVGNAKASKCRMSNRYRFPRIHIYHYAIDDEKNTYYFIFSPDFKKHIECEQLVLKKNIILRYLTVRELERLHHTKKILKSYWGNRLLNERYGSTI